MLDIVTGTMDRRGMLQRALAIVGSTFVLSACATLPKPAAARSFDLSAGQLATLAALADTIMPATDTPGAIGAGVPAGIETMLRDWASDQSREAILAALGRVDSLGGTVSFASLDAERRLALLVPHDTAALVVAAAAGTTMAQRIAGPRRVDQGYATLKELILTIYYFSEIGLQQELDYTPIPGRWDHSVPVTPATRNAGGFGVF